MSVNKRFKAISVLTLLISLSTAFADDSSTRGDKKSLEERLVELEQKLNQAKPGVKGSGIRIAGLLDTSYVVNLADRDNTGPVAGSSAQNTGRVYDNQFNSFNLNAFYLGIEKTRETSDSLVGFRVMTFYGDDATVGPSNDSSITLQQAYIDLGIPVGNTIDIKIGKTPPLLGYEISLSPANWQFSRSTSFFLTPTYPTGLFVSYPWTPNIISTVAVVNGIDTVNSGTGIAFNSGNLNTDFSFTGRVDLNGPKTSFGDFSVFVASLYGNDDPSASTSNGRPLYVWNIGGNWSHPFKINPLAFGIEYFYRQDERQAIAGVVNPSSIDASILSAYSKWDWNKWTSSSFRYTYAGFRNPAGTAAGVNGGLAPLTVPVSGFNPTYTDLSSFTLTQAFNLWTATLLRLEWRHDWTDTSTVGFGTAGTAAGRPDDIRQEQDTLAVNVVYSF